MTTAQTVSIVIKGRADAVDLDRVTAYAQTKQASQVVVFTPGFKEQAQQAMLEAEKNGHKPLLLCILPSF